MKSLTGQTFDPDRSEVTVCTQRDYLLYTYSGFVIARPSCGRWVDENGSEIDDVIVAAILNPPVNHK